MKQVQECVLDVFVASMPCPCGMGRVDAVSREADTAILELRRRHQGRIVARVHALNLHLAAFRNTPEVAKILQEKGHAALPLVVCGGRIVFSGRLGDADALDAALAPYLDPPQDVATPCGEAGA